MRIKSIKSRNGLDFHAIFECEHCGYTCWGYGIDDDDFYRKIIPDIECQKCGKKTSYAANEVVQW